MRQRVSHVSLTRAAILPVHHAKCGPHHRLDVAPLPAFAARRTSSRYTPIGGRCHREKRIFNADTGSMAARERADHTRPAAPLSLSLSVSPACWSFDAVGHLRIGRRRHGTQPRDRGMSRRVRQRTPVDCKTLHDFNIVRSDSVSHSRPMSHVPVSSRGVITLHGFGTASTTWPSWYRRTTSARHSQSRGKLFPLRRYYWNPVKPAKESSPEESRTPLLG